MRISHFFATSIVAIFAFTESSNATYVNQLEKNQIETGVPQVNIALTQIDSVTEATEETEEEIARKKVIEQFGWSGLNDNEKQRLT